MQATSACETTHVSTQNSEVRTPFINSLQTGTVEMRIEPRRAYVTPAFSVRNSPPTKHCDERVCLSVCLSVRLHISKITPHAQISPNFLYTLPVAVLRSSCGDSAICYALPVLPMTSCFHIMERVGHSQRRRTCLAEFARWRLRRRSLPSTTASFSTWAQQKSVTYILKSWSFATGGVFDEV